MNVRKIINILYQILFFIVPLILYPYTSELFEFNKMIAVYILTVLILFFWAVRGVSERKIIIKRTPLDIPILIFLGSQIISTLISIDIRTSLFGYYSRFNGGLISLFCYAILYWGYVSNLSKNDTLTHIKVILISTFLSSLYGILEHFGIDKNIWIQDVEDRVFSTFGQPNWLAAWLAAVIPVSLSISLSLSSRSNEKESNLQTRNVTTFIPYILAGIFFITLLFTKSRSGILGLIIALIVYWGLIFIKTVNSKTEFKSFLKSVFAFVISFTLIVFLIGSPWTPNISEVLDSLQNHKSITYNLQPTTTAAPALEVGGSSSTEIRKIVWRGALDVWKNYPLFGSGVETFAFSYYKFRPAAHNLVSEWDFLYNKAHNEYLNFMATSGTIGIISYLTLITFFAVIFIRSIFTNYTNPSRNTRMDKIGDNPRRISEISEKTIILSDRTNILNIAIFSGYVSILLTNFFGFSVVPVNLLFYLFPAMVISLGQEGKTVKEQELNIEKLSGIQKIFIFIACLFTLLVFYSIARYWYADVLYNRADQLAKSGNLIDAVKSINSSIKLSGSEAIYHDELASELMDVALVYNSQNATESAKKFSENALTQINFAEKLSPINLNIIRNKARIAIQLSEINPAYILDAKNELLKGISLAPTDAKLYYNLSLVYFRINDIPNTIETLKKTIELKANYRDARYAYAIVLSENDNAEEAEKQLQYILKYIDPNDINAQKMLDETNNIFPSQ